MTKAKPRDVSDYGTPELHARHRVRVEKADKRRLRVRIVDGTALDRLLLREQITVPQHSAGVAYAGEVERAGINSMPGMNLNSTTRGPRTSLSNRQAEAIHAINSIEKWLKGRVGQSGVLVLSEVVVLDRDPTPRTLPLVVETLGSLMGYYDMVHGISRRSYRLIGNT